MKGTILLLAFVATMFLGIMQAQGTIISVSSQLCNIVTDVKLVVGVFTLVMFIVGGVLYAAAHFLPAAGQIRGNLQGWAMGMIVGGIVGLIIIIIAPYVVTTIAGFGSGISLGSC
ncbi:MAG: hypothetical protein ACP5TK_01715 [Candidatus Micrarchaeia archaeon]